MPVQINEIIIRAVVAPAPASSSTKQPSTANSGNADYEIAEKVLEIIKEKLER